MGTVKTTEATWSELLGSNRWEGLLNPLDLSLRKLILRCGDFCQATYDAFNSDANSNFCGSCRYGKQCFFNKVHLPSASNYQVVAFIYATSKVDAALVPGLAWDCQSNWIGYIAVTTDDVTKANGGRREIYVAWRGTMQQLEWLDDFDHKLVSAKPLLDNDNARVSEGWLKVYTCNNPNSLFSKTSARAQVLTKIKELLNKYKDEALSLTFTGHSLGAALAALSAFDVAENVAANIPVAAFAFALPMLGNKALSDKINAHQNLRILHVKNTIDLVPNYPGMLLGFATVGTEVVVDTRKSPSLKSSFNPGDWHNLEALLHTVAGWDGNDGKFEVKVKRCLALVNKSCDLLKTECKVPGSWWVEKNKGMVIDENGDWVTALPFEEDKPDLE